MVSLYPRRRNHTHAYTLPESLIKLVSTEQTKHNNHKSIFKKGLLYLHLASGVRIHPSVCVCAATTAVHFPTYYGH